MTSPPIDTVKKISVCRGQLSRVRTQKVIDTPLGNARVYKDHFGTDDSGLEDI
jgi:hypothetical protein